MNAQEEFMLRHAIKPLAHTFMTTWVEAMVLRVKVHMELALANGCEDEDLPEVIARAIESATPLTNKYIDNLGEVNKANGIQSGTH